MCGVEAHADAGEEHGEFQPDESRVSERLDGGAEEDVCLTDRLVKMEKRDRRHDITDPVGCGRERPQPREFSYLVRGTCKGETPAISHVVRVGIGPLSCTVHPGEELLPPPSPSAAVRTTDPLGTPLDVRAVALGVAAQWLHIVVLYVATPLEGAVAGSLFLLLATGLVGGLVAGDRAGPPVRRSARHGLVAGAVGGAGTSAVFWWTMATPGASRGAFRSLAYLVATGPIPGVRSHGELVVALSAVLLGLGIASMAWVAGRRAPDRAQSFLE